MGDSMKWTVIVSLLISLFLAAYAFADEPACKATGETVVCQRAGFDKLVDKCVGFDAAAKACGIRLAEAERAVSETGAMLNQCLTRPVPPPPPPPPASRRPLVGALVAAVGGAVLAGAVASDASGAWVVAGGVVTVAGVALAIPW